MAKYTVRDTRTGKKITFQWNGDQPPTQNDMQEVFNQARTMQPITQPEQAQQPNNDPSGSFGDVMRGVAGKVVPYTEHALPMAGALAGGVGGLVGGPVGSLAGAGLGYAGGAQVQDVLEQYAGMTPQKTVGQELMEMPKDVLTGAAMEAGGLAVGGGLKLAGGVANKLAPKIYESVAKFKPSLDKEIRDRAVKTALKYNISPTEKGLIKLQKMIEGTNSEIGAVINKAKNAGDTVKTMDIVDSVKSNFTKWAKKKEVFSPELKQLEKYLDDVLRDNGKIIDVKKAQTLKSNIYKKLKKAYDPHADDVAIAGNKLKKEFASGVRKELIKKFPVLERLGMKDRNLLQLEKELERTVNRTRNWNIVGLQDLVGGGAGALAGLGESRNKKGIGMGALIGLALTRGLRSPAIMSQLSFLLNKAGQKVGAPILQRAIGYPLGKGAASGADVEGAIDTAMGATATPAQAMSQPPQLSPTGKMSLQLYRDAQQAYLGGRYDEALTLFKQLTLEDPKRSIIYKKAIDQINAEKQGSKNYSMRGTNR